MGCCAERPQGIALATVRGNLDYRLRLEGKGGTLFADYTAWRAISRSVLAVDVKVNLGLCVKSSTCY